MTRTFFSLAAAALMAGTLAAPAGARSLPICFGGQTHGCIPAPGSKAPKAHHHAPGRSGPTPLAWYALGSTWCGAAGLVFRALVVNATERRELTSREAWGTYLHCLAPGLGFIADPPR